MRDPPRQGFTGRSRQAKTWATLHPSPERSTPECQEIDDGAQVGAAGAARCTGVREQSDSTITDGECPGLDEASLWHWYAIGCVKSWPDCGS